MCRFCLLQMAGMAYIYIYIYLEKKERKTQACDQVRLYSALNT